MNQAEQLKRRLGRLKSIRLPMEIIWKDCFNHSHPLRGNGLNGDSYDPSTAKNKQARLLSSIGTDSARVLASSVMGGMTPANSQWFELDMGNEAADEKRWLSDSARLLWENIHMGNFDSVGYECQLDLVDAGWFVMHIDEAEGGGFNFEQWPIAECYVASSRPGAPVDTVFREFKYTIEQAVNAYGLKNMSQEVQEAYQAQKYDDIITMCLAIYPRRMFMENARLPKNMPIAHEVFEVKTCKMVLESGYHELPVIVPRWMTLLGTAYGIGPMSEALPDLKTLNEIKGMELASLDLSLSGMWIATDDGVLNPKTVKVGPRKVIIANSTDSIKPLTSGVDFNVGFMSQERLEASIRKLLMADQLQPQDGPDMTATEVHVRVGMIRQLMGPLYGRLQAEYLTAMLTRCFGIAYRAGVFGPAPDSIKGRNFSVRYISPLARAQKMEDVSAIQQVYGLAGQIAQARGGDVSVFDNLDDDQALTVAADALGAPTKIMRKPEAVGDIRQRSQEAKQQAAEQEQAAAMQQEVGTQAAKQLMVA
ncbi:MAG TPA: portal protein [Methylovorus sp.]|nr:portal protein [Methylovorus sp.]